MERPRPMPPDPATAAAALLVRVGFAMLVIGVPLAMPFSRRAIVIIVPVAGLTLVFAALLRIGAREIVRRMRVAIESPAGLGALFVMVWAALSLAWTPFPGEAADKLVKVAGVALLAVGVAAAMPRLMRGSNLHLVSLGAVIGLLAMAVALARPFLAETPLQALPADAATGPRAAMLLSGLVWAAVAWLAIKARLALGLALLVALGVAQVALGAVEAAISLAVALMIYGASWRTPARAGRVLGLVLAALVLLAPALVTVFGLLVSDSFVILQPATLWAAVVSADPLRLLTGHGFDTLQRARGAGLVPAATGGGLLADTWFELGLPGAVGLALALRAGAARAGRLGLELGPAALAAIGALAAYSVLAQSAGQTWWFNGMALTGVTLLAVAHGRYRTVRPRAEFAARS